MSSSVARMSMFPMMGVNLQKDPMDVGEQECVSSKNLFPKTPGGILAARDALAVHREVGWIQAYDVGNPPVLRHNQIQWHERLNGGYVTYQRQDTLGQDAIVVYREWGPLATPGVTEVVAVPQRTPPWMVPVNDKVYVLNGQNLMVVTSPTAGALTIIPSPIATITPALAVNVRSRMWYADLGPGKENRIIVSDRFIPEQLGNELTWSFDVGPSEEGPITAIAEAAVTDGGSQESNVVLVWKRDVLYIISGEPAQTTDTPGTVTDWRLGTLNILKAQVRAGCVGQRTVATTERGTFWRGPNDIWFMPFGSSPIAVGTKIRPALTRAAREREPWMYGVWADGVYRVSTDADDDLTVMPAATHVRPPSQEFWLDCRTPEGADESGFPLDAASARWWGPMEYRTVLPSDVEMRGPLYMRPKTDGSVSVPEALVSAEFLSNTPGTGGSSSLIPFKAAEGAFIVQVGTRRWFDAVVPVREPQLWTQNTQYELGDEVVPTAARMGPTDHISYMLHTLGVFRKWVCIRAGTSGTNPPDFDNTMSPLATDNTVLWGTLAGVPVSLGLAISDYLPASMMLPIDVELITKEYDFGDAVINKLVQGMEVVHFNESVVKLRVLSIIDYESTEFTMTVGNMVRLGGAIPTNIDRRPHLDYLPLDLGGTRRLVGRTAQFRLSVQPRPYVVLAGENQLKMELNGNGGNTTVTVAPGEYTDFTQLLTAFIIAFNTAMTGTPLNGLVGVVGTTSGFVTVVANVADCALINVFAEGSALAALLGFPYALVRSTQAFGLTICSGWVGLPTNPPSGLGLKVLNARVRPFSRRFK